MIQKQYTLSALIISTSALFLCSCHNIEEEIVDEHQQLQAEEFGAQSLDMPTTYVTKIPDLHNETKTDKLNAATTAPAAAALASAEIAPMNQPTPFGDVSAPQTIAPWHAMYINSYGQLPTRFQDKGPFLYSFDLDPKASNLRDNNLGPLEFLGDADDDDDF